MNSSLNSFQQYMYDGVIRFVQSAVIIDNEAEISGTKKAPPPFPVTAVRSSGSLFASKGKSPQEVFSEKKQDVTVSVDGASDEQELNAKILTDAWSDREVICGLYRPEPGEEMVALAVKAAAHADVIILDWFLENSSSQKAKNIITELLMRDSVDQGRLRLICIYTSQPGISSIASSIFETVEDVADLKGKLTLDGAVVTGAGVRIVVISKPQTMGSADVDKVEEAKLPERLIAEFSCLSNGLLTTFALHAVAAVRRAAHHVVAVFKEDLDGAYIGHRCSIGEPENARDFAIDLIVGQLRNVISIDESTESSLSEQVLLAWVDYKGIDRFPVADNKWAPVSFVKTLLQDGLSALQTKEIRLVNDSGAPVKGTIPQQNVGRLFYDDTEAAWNSHLDFSRVSTFKREGFGNTRLPTNFRPTLTLGSVLKILGPKNDAEQAKYADLKAEYYVCVQPRCDSVRLEGGSSFPFQKAGSSKTIFNLVVKERDTSSGSPILISTKLSDVVMLDFLPDSSSKTVRAEARADGYVYVDLVGREFLWLGDINDLKAQHSASALAANIHRVGFDEHEWLRLVASNSHKDISFRPAD